LPPMLRLVLPEVLVKADRGYLKPAVAKDDVPNCRSKNAPRKSWIIEELTKNEQW